MKKNNQKTIKLTDQFGGVLRFATATIIGQVGVHCGINDNSDEWIVTHIPTGDCVAQCPNELVALALARWIEKQVPQNKHRAWQSCDHATARRVFGNPAKTRARVKAKVRQLAEKQNGAIT